MDERDASAEDMQAAMVRALVRTADARRQQGRYPDAIRLYQQALDLCDAAFGPGAPERTAIVRSLALIDGAQRSG